MPVANKDIPSIIRHIPIKIATNNGCANVNVATKNNAIPNMKINANATLDMVSDPRITPIIPTNIIINEII